MEHWDRYAKNSRIAIEIQQLTKATDELLDGLAQLARADEHFIVDDIDLPDSLGIRSFCATPRNLFSVGFDEVGLLAAGRGLEGVLRQIARRKRRILLQARGKEARNRHTRSTSTISLKSCSESAGRLEFDVELISRETQIAASVRMCGPFEIAEHARRNRSNETSSPRETAKSYDTSRPQTHVVAEFSCKTRVRVIHPTTVEKDWP